jgi:hypothetical protein
MELSTFCYSREVSEDYRWMSPPQYLSGSDSWELKKLFQKYKETAFANNSIFVELGTNNSLILCRFVNTKTKDCYGRDIFAIYGFETSPIANKDICNNLIAYFSVKRCFSDCKINDQTLHSYVAQNQQAKAIINMLTDKKIAVGVWYQISRDHIMQVSLNISTKPNTQQATKKNCILLNMFKSIKKIFFEN